MHNKVGGSSGSSAEWCKTFATFATFAFRALQSTEVVVEGPPNLCGFRPEDPGFSMRARMSQFILRHTAPQVERTMQKRAADAGFGPRVVGYPSICNLYGSLTNVVIRHPLDCYLVY